MGYTRIDYNSSSEFIYKDEAGLIWRRIYIDVNENKSITFHIRWALNIDDANGNGHYRCEIVNGEIIEEVLPNYADYNILMSWKDEILQVFEDDKLNILKSAYANKKIKPSRF